MSPCLRDALRQYFPEQTVKGNGNYLPVDAARFKSGIPSLLDDGETPAMTLGLYDIDCNPPLFVNGSSFEDLKTIVAELSHTQQFLQVWDDLKNNRFKNFIKHGNLNNKLSRCSERVGRQLYLLFR